VTVEKGVVGGAQLKKDATNGGEGREEEWVRAKEREGAR